LPHVQKPDRQEQVVIIVYDNIQAARKTTRVRAARLYLECVILKRVTLKRCLH